MGTDVFFSFSDWSSGRPLDLDAILREVEHRTEEDAYHLVFRRGGDLFAVKAQTDVGTEEDTYDPPVRHPRHLSEARQDEGSERAVQRAEQES